MEVPGRSQALPHRVFPGCGGGRGWKLTPRVMGGADAVIENACKAYHDGDYRWAVEVLNHIVFADPTNQDAWNLEADVMERMGYQAEAGTWRNWFLTAAQELRHGVHRMPIPNMMSPAMIDAVPKEEYLLKV